MVNAVTVTNFRGESLRLELANYEASGILITEITGLGPTKAILNSTETATKDGSEPNSARLQKRNIVLSCEFYSTGAETVEEIRNKTYKYFPTKKNCTLLFETDTKTAICHGRVETNEPDIFKPNESCQISIICDDPYFYASDSKGNQKRSTTIFYGEVPMFGFPFPDEEAEEPAIITGELVKKQENTVLYTGEGEPGVQIVINATGEVTNLKIYNLFTREHFYLDTDKLQVMTGSPIIAGDQITIDTNKGSKSVVLLRDGQEINILRCMVKGSDWFTLAKGDNLFAFTVDSGTSYISFKVLNDIVYIGI